VAVSALFADLRGGGSLHESALLLQHLLLLLLLLQLRRLLYLLLLLMLLRRLLLLRRMLLHEGLLLHVLRSRTRGQHRADFQGGEGLGAGYFEGAELRRRRRRDACVDLRQSLLIQQVSPLVLEEPRRIGRRERSLEVVLGHGRQRRRGQCCATCSESCMMKHGECMNQVPRRVCVRCTGGECAVQ
jgi:hypothetical protein